MGSSGDFLGGSGVKHLPCNVRDSGLIPDWELRSHMPSRVAKRVKKKKTTRTQRTTRKGSFL